MKLCALHEKCSCSESSEDVKLCGLRSGVIKLKISQKNLILLSVAVCHILAIKLCKVFLEKFGIFPVIFSC